MLFSTMYGDRLLPAAICMESEMEKYARYCLFSGLFAAFYEAAFEDPRLGPVHISLYSALLCQWQRQDFCHPMRVSAHDLMPLAKICGSATYHKSIRDLHAFGYIRYLPSRYCVEGSQVFFRGLSALLKKHQPIV